MDSSFHHENWLQMAIAFVWSVSSSKRWDWENIMHGKNMRQNTCRGSPLLRQNFFQTFFPRITLNKLGSGTTEGTTQRISGLIIIKDPWILKQRFYRSGTYIYPSCVRSWHRTLLLRSGKNYRRRMWFSRKIYSWSDRIPCQRGNSAKT